MKDELHLADFLKVDLKEGFAEWWDLPSLNYLDPYADLLIYWDSKTKHRKGRRVSQAKRWRTSDKEFHDWWQTIKPKLDFAEMIAIANRMK